MLRSKINLTELTGFETIVFPDTMTLPVTRNNPKEEVIGRATIYTEDDQVLADLNLNGNVDFTELSIGGQKVSDSEFHLSYIHIVK